MTANSDVSDILIFYCNGQKIQENHADPESSLAKYLRKKLHLTGCKIGCEQGACGACTVMISSIDHNTMEISHVAVNACLYPLCAIHGKAVTTIEGIGSTETKLHPIQERLAKSHGSQCGFCSPGMVMSLYTLLRNKPKPASEDVMRTLEGNWCRCTGYRPILDAFNTFTECTELYRTSDLFDCVYDPSQDIIFPPQLQTNIRDFKKTVMFSSSRQTWITASTLQELLELKMTHPKAQIVGGNTYKAYKGIEQLSDVRLSTSTSIKELYDLDIDDQMLKVGAMVTMAKLQTFLNTRIASSQEPKSRLLVTISKMLNRYANQQIRNVATIGGQILTSATDIKAILLATGSHVTVSKKGSSRRILLDQEFYNGNLKPCGSWIDDEEVLVCVDIPLTKDNQHIHSYKMTPRRQQSDGAILNAAYFVTFKPNSDIVKNSRIVFFGLRSASLPSYAQETCSKMVEKNWDESLLQEVTASLKGEHITERLVTDPSVEYMGADPSVEYMGALVTSSFYKFYLEVLQELKDNKIPSNAVPTSSRSVVYDFPVTTPRGTQIFEPVPIDQADIDPLGRPLVHRSALQQVSGEAQYTDDIPSVEGELHLALILPTRGRAKVVSVDTKDALSLEGVVTYVSAEDAPKTNMTSENEEVFVTKQVYSVGQIHGAIVAISPDIARRAEKMVKIEYEELPAIVTIEDAMKQNRVYGPPKVLCKGDPEGVFDQCPVVFEGSVRTHGQEHFYIEPSSCVMRPSGEVGEIDVYMGFQFMRRVQEEMARVLGVDENKINCHTKRIGGGFGGKSNRFLHYLACAVAVKKTRRSVRMNLNRSEDMRLTGHRESNLAFYKVGCDATGRIIALDLVVHTNAGTPDSMATVLSSELGFLMDNVYVIDNIRVSSIMYETNLPPIAPMRAFTSIENIFIIENIMTDIATKCGLPQNQVREINMHTGDSPCTYFGLPIEDYDNFKTCWQECKDRGQYNIRRREVDAYNSQSRWTKRGLAMIPLKFNVGTFAKSFHQGAALINAYIDGSILIYIGGVEIGQGLFTKMIQIASRVLGIPVERIHIKESMTGVIPNPTDTAASSASDIFGMAVKDGCEILRDRIKPYKDTNPTGNFHDWVQAAFEDRVNLSVIGFYKTPGLNWSWETKTGRPYPYHTYGVACSEVEIDCLTGTHHLLRTDIVMDIGRSLNPAIDIGQVEGAFMMGYGYFTFEDLKWSDDGTLLTDGPREYKIPCVMDVPETFNVTLLRNSRNPKAVYSSKAIGEPPVCLANTVFFAIKDAIQSARMDIGITGVFQMDTPASPERVRLACDDVDSVRGVCNGI